MFVVLKGSVLQLTVYELLLPQVCNKTDSFFPFFYDRHSQVSLDENIFKHTPPIKKGLLGPGPKVLQRISDNRKVPVTCKPVIKLKKPVQDLYI